MKYFSTFAGTGGFEAAIHQVFPDAHCVGYSEIDKYAIETYQRHFPNHINYGDITTIDEKALPDFDLLVGGSSCQDLSIARKGRQGLAGSKSKVFFDYVRILKEKKPKYFILENVATMSKEAKATMEEILGVKAIEINSARVSGQRRRRLYFTNIPNITQPEDLNIHLTRNGVPVHAWSKSTRSKQKLVMECGAELILPNHYNERIRVDGKANTLVCSEANSDSINFFPDEVLDFKSRVVWKRHQLYSAQITKDQMLTPEERERLQGFDIGWTKTVPKSQRIKQMGNAVNVPTIKHILKHIKSL